MKTKFRKIISILMAIAIVVTVGSVMASAEDIATDSWMSGINDNSLITEINIPGTHDSASRYVAAGAIAQTQSMTIAEQLKIGVRYFDLRINHENDDFNLVHDTANCKTGSSSSAADLTGANVVSYFKNFLSKHPTETILCLVKEERSSTGNAFYTDFYQKYISANKDLWYTENRIPALSEVRGKIVVLRAVSVDSSKFDDSTCGIDFKAYPYVPTLETNDYRNVPVSKMSGTQYSYLYVQDSFKVEGDDKWTAITNFLESDLSADGFNVCCTNCANSKLPSSNASAINAKFNDYELTNGKVYGIISMDYINAKLTTKIIATNNIVVVPTQVTTTRTLSDKINELFAKLIEFFMSLFSFGK